MALEQHLRPTAVLFRDPHFGHRNWHTDRPDGAQNDWTPWDFAIGTAMQIIEDGTTEEGHLIWEVEDERVFVEPVKKWNKVRRAIEVVTDSKDYKSTPGEYWRPVLRQFGVEPGEETHWQTRSEWIEKMLKGDEPIN